MTFLMLAAAVLAAAPTTSATSSGPVEPGRVPVLILTGNSVNDWRWTSTYMRQVLEDSGKFDVEISLYPDGSLLDRDALTRFRVLVVDYEGARWGALAEERFLESVEAGTGVVALNAATTAFRDWPQWRDVIGVAPTDLLASGFGLVDVAVGNREHPITSGLGEFAGHVDVLLPVEASGGEVLATAGRDSTPAVVVGRHGEGRTVAIPLGNVAVGRPETWPAQNDPQFQQLLLRAVEWAANGSVTAMRRVEPNTLSPADRAEGWRLLFDGSSVSGWEGLGGRGFPEDRWDVRDGQLRILPGEAGEGDIVTAETFAEYELELEWRVAEGAEYVESGLSIGVDADAPQAPGFDVSLDSQADHALGWELLRPAGEYNHVRIEARNDRIRHWLNGVRLLTLHVAPGELAERLRGQNMAEDPELSRTPFGRIALKNRGTAIWFRNIKIRSLSRPPLGNGGNGAPGGVARQLFDGRTLDGWTWAPQVNPRDPVPFDVGEAGTLRNFGIAWGYLRLDAEHRDFALELDWRYDAETRTVGEASVVLRGLPLDDAGERVTTWFQGLEVMLGAEVVGNVRRRGDFPLRFDVERREGEILRRLPWRFLPRPPEQWNHLEIRVEGEGLLVKVNGEVLNAADGLGRDGGMLALLAEGGPLEYRNIRLTPLSR